MFLNIEQNVLILNIKELKYFSNQVMIKYTRLVEN